MRILIAPLALLVLAGSALAQTPAPAPAAAPRILKYSLAPRPDPLTPWTLPNKPHWRLVELLAAHKGEPRWSQTLVQDRTFTGRYIQMAPGEKTKRLFYPDNEIFWVVQSGQMRVSIDGLEPFVAGKSVVVQVPQRTAFHVETLGNEPVLRFEVTYTGMPPVYAGRKRHPAKRASHLYASPIPQDRQQSSPRRRSISTTTRMWCRAAAVAAGSSRRAASFAARPFPPRRAMIWAISTSRPASSGS